MPKLKKPTTPPRATGQFTARSPPHNLTYERNVQTPLKPPHPSTQETSNSPRTTTPSTSKVEVLQKPSNTPTTPKSPDVRARVPEEPVMRRTPDKYDLMNRKELIQAAKQMTKTLKSSMKAVPSAQKSKSEIQAHVIKSAQSPVPYQTTTIHTDKPSPNDSKTSQSKPITSQPMTDKQSNTTTITTDSNYSSTDPSKPELRRSTRIRQQPSYFKNFTLSLPSRKK
jgi:hypothetical protein